MKAKYISVWKLAGGNRVASESGELAIVQLANPTIAASIVSDPESYFPHIDRAAALGVLLLSGLFTPRGGGTPEERLAAEIEILKARRGPRTGLGAFLVFEGETDVESPDFALRRDTAEFAVCFDAINKQQIASTFDSSIKSVLAAVVMSLPAGIERRVEPVGGVIFLVDPEADKPIYSFSMADKYRLADKFLIIASVLDNDGNASVDAANFQRLKTTRDSLLHALEIPASLPTDATQELLLKYTRAHLERVVEEGREQAPARAEAK